jgi:beta-carotene hydroxylase
MARISNRQIGVSNNQINRSLVQLPQGFLNNPTVWLFNIDVAVFATSSALFLNGTISRYVAGVVATICLYCLYTVGHEAAHGNAHPTRLINAWMGRISSALEGLTFPLFRIIHLQHHAFTNDDVRDPDFVIGRQPRWLLPLWTVVRLLHDNQFMLRRGLWSGRPKQLLEHVATVALQVAIVVACVATGRTELVLWGWLGPIVVSGALLELSVAWAVHYPHTSQHPLESTRMFHGKLLQILMLNQNFHLVHHLWPRIPWFRYAQARAAADRAVAEHRSGARDEGWRQQAEDDQGAAKAALDGVQP